MLKVLHLIDSLGPGGAERSIVDLRPELEDREISLTLVCLAQVPQALEEALALKARGRAARVMEARQLVRAFQADIVHTTLFEADLIGRLAAVGTRIPVLTSLVNTTYDPVRAQIDPNVSTRRLAIAREIDGFAARHLTNHFHAISQAVKDSAVENLRIKPEDVTVIPRGRSMDRIGEPSASRRRAVRKSLGLDESHEVVLSIGRQEYQKGHVHLLEAATNLQQKRPLLRILVAGREGNASSDLRKAMSDLRLESTVTFLGNRNDVGDLLAAADVFCFPSLYEGLGGALIEAMLMRVPIVASDLPAIREVVGPSGTLVPPASPDVLTKALATLLGNPAYAADLAHLAHQRARALFNLDKVADQMAAMYRRVAANRNQ